MNKNSVNTFIKGLNQDIDKSVISKDSYLDALNFRIVTSEGASSGAFENIKGNKWIGSTGLLPSGQLICGSIRLREYIILFSTTNTGIPVHGIGRSMIHTLTLDKVNEEVDTLTLIYDDNLNSGTSTDTLDFSTLYKIKAISRYETPNIQKVYWTDGYNNLRYLNVAANLTITGGAYISNNFMATSMFEFLPAFIPSRPILVDIIGGHLMGGMVQYSYQLYRLNGAETAFSPVSDMIHIVNDGDFKSNTLLYSGDSESIQTGKGCKLSITYNDSGYNRIRLVRIHYSTLNSIPVIAVANEIEISTTAGTVEITDVGETINSLTLDEFNISSTELFKCEDISTKDNRLFAANIDKSDFKSDATVEAWDARAVRFRAISIDSTAYLVDSIPANNITLAGNLSDWVAKYTDTHDGINPSNDPDNVGNNYIFQGNGSTVGAEGLNIKIDFETENFDLDVSNDNSTFYTTPPSVIPADPSYKNYASPWKDGKLSWQRDEVYRLFAVFGNDRGQVADPKWIIDLRMPSFHDEELFNSEGYPVQASSLSYYHTLTGKTSGTRLYPRVYFKSFPTNATWVQIYRVKRERSDRSVVTQGIAVPSQVVDNIYYPNQVLAPIPSDYEIFKLVSPELLITKNIIKQANDYIEYVTNYSIGNVVTPVSYDGGSVRFGDVIKMLTNTRVPFTSDVITPINDAVVVSPASTGEDTGIVTIDSKDYINYVPYIEGKGCTGMVVSYSKNTWSAETINCVVVNYKSNVYGSQYGGHTYESRMLNISIPCSDVIPNIDAEGGKLHWVDIPYGDTFINYFDVSTILADLSRDAWSGDWRNPGSCTETVYVPLESSINLDLRHDLETAHQYPIPTDYTMYAPYLRQEYSGQHVLTASVNSANTLTFNQTKDLYLYNTVYSQQTSAQYGISSMLDISNETSFDCLVKASNIKYNGELSDSWTKFNINEEIEVDSNYGPIRAINTVNDKLLYWQEDAFGMLSVNVRSLIQDSSSAQLALGTGGLLDRYDYISSTVGILDKFAIVNSDSSVYWFYDKDTSVYQFNNKLSNLSKDKGMWSWFKTYYSSLYSVHGIYDRTYNDIIFTLYKADQTGYTIAFNEQTDQFTSFYSFVPRMYIDYKDGYLSVKDYVTNTYSYVFMHNSNINPRCRFYSLLAYNVADLPNTFESTVKVLYNQDYPITKVFDNIFYISNAFAELTNIEQYDTTFDKVRCYNDYQNTGYVTLAYPTNVMRRDRGWTLVVPRNMVHHDISESVDILTDVAATKVWHERIRDKYMVLDLSFNNTTKTRFVVPFIGVKTRASYR